MTRSAADDPARYGGDARLAELLAAERAGKSVADVRGIIAGVLSAPEDVEGDLWLGLVALQASGELRNQLQALKDSIASRRGYGLDAPPPAPAWRLKALRRELERLGLDGFIVPHADEHQGEMLAMRSERLNWLTGFGGSAGVAVVLKEKAAIFVDGRYTLQVKVQVRKEDFAFHHLINEPPTDWIAEHLAGGRLGYDPWLHGAREIESLERTVANSGGELVPCRHNPVDAVWPNPPPPPLSPRPPSRSGIRRRIGLLEDRTDCTITC